MASSSAPFTLFPAPPRQASPRKSELQKASNSKDLPPALELKGLALQVTATPPPPKVYPAGEHIKHSLFCNEPPGPPKTTQRSYRHRPARQSAGASSKSTHRKDSPLNVQEDQLPPLPINTQFNSSPPSKHPGKRLQQPCVPRNLSTQALSDPEETKEPDDDCLSPLPEKTRFTPVSPKSSEYHTPLSERSNSTWPSTNSSPLNKQAPHSPDHIQPMRSMFPRYDPSKPLDRQHYFPSIAVPSIPTEKVSKVAGPLEHSVLHRFDSAIGLDNERSDVPIADTNDVNAIWSASNDIAPRSPRKVQLSVCQNVQSDTIAIEAFPSQPIFSVDKALPQSPSQTSKAAKHLSIEKHDPRDGSATQVAQLVLPEIKAGNEKAAEDALVIFPQAAAISALEAAASSSAAQEIATFDPSARSPEATRLAQDAVAEAQRRYGCHLSRKVNKRDSLGAHKTAYTLEHSSMGSLTVTINSSGKQRDTKAHGCRICIHHPTATPAAIAAETLVLASLDCSQQTCVLDVPGILALNCRYLVDTVMATLLAVASMESGQSTVETPTFAPPPKSPLGEKKRGRKKRAGKTSDSRKWYKRSSKAINHVQKELVGQPADVGPPVQAAVAILGFTAKSAVFVLEAAVKVTAGAVKHIAARA
ncbi:hypothetical protein KC340_g3789 [Hortaea werneckii]|nr:hypothetical protein KC342_g4046 [Hortaea werneckii]KAI7102357.1 hypothetical protein KC339_g6090 [Hortaea werneckii]KAI7213303.1 hypothetical protein KC365_g14319 [Hortaea werneckii]KAI7331502.1 hypothetical protein KC340_g3789 [Hortaea werneckii]KAI7382048.1 hypothetical protein KC328_g11901 [Hortaea werneckii]